MVRGRTMERRTLPRYPAGAVDVPFVMSAMSEAVRRHTRWAPHSHPTHELLWNERGASSATVEDRIWTITPRWGLWLPAGTVHDGEAPRGTVYRAAQFRIDAVPALADRPVAIEITPLLRLLLDRVVAEDLEPESQRLTESMIIDVARPAPVDFAVQLPHDPRLRPMLDVLLADPGDPRMLADWASELGLSTRTVTRLLAEQTGQGYAQWVSAVRSQRAIALLSAGIPVEEVAGLVGYRSASAFCSAFRRVVGLTPGALLPAQ